jgi:hypothetical protein
VAACVVEVLALCASAAVVALACVPFVPQLAHDPRIRYIALGAPLGLALMHPRLIEWGLNLLARTLKRRQVRIEVSYARLLLVPVVFVIPWLLLGAHIHLLCLGLSAGHPPFALSVGANTVSWAGGFLLAFAPGGLGVREGMAALMLSLAVPEPAAVAVALVSRVMLTACELLATGILTWHHRRFVRATLAAAREGDAARGGEGLAT